jgi:hypothetical protein
MVSRIHRKAAALVLAALLSAACDREPSGPAPAGVTDAGPPQAPGEAEDFSVAAQRARFEAHPAAPGAIEGLVLYAGVPPVRTPIHTAAEGGCGLDPNEPALTDAWVVDQGRLANAFVWLENPPAFDEVLPFPEFTLRQRGCVYRPHALGLRVGQKLLVTNEDRARHNVRAIPRRNPEFNASQEAGAPALELVFTEPEVAVALVCDLHPWMKAWVGVFDQPYFAVTDGEGRFAWSGLPAGEYRLRVWHEALGKLSGSARVGPDGGARVCLVYPPKD